MTGWYVRCLGHDTSVSQHYKSEHWAPCCSWTPSWYDLKIVGSDVKPEQTNHSEFCLNLLMPSRPVGATSWQSLLLSYANKGADQPAHPHSMISAFVVRCLDSIIPLVSISEISNLWLRRPICVLPGCKPQRQVFSWWGSFYLCRFDKSVFDLRMYGLFYFQFFKMLFLSSKKWRPWSDPAFCGVWSGWTFFYLDLIYGTLGTKWFNCTQDPMTLASSYLQILHDKQLA